MFVQKGYILSSFGNHTNEQEKSVNADIDNQEY